MEFRSKKIIKETEKLGEKLRDHRKKQKIGLEIVKKKLKINTNYIKHLESDNYEKLPPGVYTINLIKKYASFLNINDEEINNILEKKFPKTNSKKINKHNQKIFGKKNINFKNFLIFPKIIKNVIIFIVVLACFCYLGFKLKKSFDPPILYIENPPENFITDKQRIEIIGKTELETEISINGHNIPILKNDNGKFNYWINVKKGINEIIIIANKKNKKNIIKKQILVK